MLDESPNQMTTLDRITHKIFLNPSDLDLSVYNDAQTVFTNGCFDLVHTGHITYLSKAADLGDALIIGLNSDASVRRLKGASRPVKDEENRALLLASFEFVSAVVLFEEDTPLSLIKAIKPNVLVKGGDYDPSCTDPNDPKYIVGSDLVSEYGGNISTIPFVEGHSTTNLIGKMHNK